MCSTASSIQLCRNWYSLHLPYVQELHCLQHPAMQELVQPPSPLCTGTALPPTSCYAGPQSPLYAWTAGPPSYESGSRLCWTGLWPETGKMDNLNRKNAVDFFWDAWKGLASTRRSLQPSRALQNIFGHLWAILDPDPDPRAHRIRIGNTAGCYRLPHAHAMQWLPTLCMIWCMTESLSRSPQTEKSGWSSPPSPPLLRAITGGAAKKTGS